MPGSSSSESSVYFLGANDSRKGFPPCEPPSKSSTCPKGSFEIAVDNDLLRTILATCVGTRLVSRTSWFATCRCAGIAEHFTGALVRRWSRGGAFSLVFLASGYDYHYHDYHYSSYYSSNFYSYWYSCYYDYHHHYYH